MENAPDLKGFVDEIISSYEDRLQSISSIIDNTRMILGEFQESMANTRQEREDMKIQLRDTLAKNESLRKKDFDVMMNTILTSQEDREKEVRSLLNNFLTEQKEMTTTLRESLGGSREALNQNNASRLTEYHQLLKQILDDQEKRKQEVVGKLETFQREQKELSCTLEQLLSKGRQLRIRDLKSMLRSFQMQSMERRTYQIRRKEDVQRMLDMFRQERVERRLYK